MRAKSSPPSVASRYALLALGASTAALQTLAIREGMAAAGGNEAVVALLFGVWMLETALGAFIARRRRSSPARTGLGLALYAALSIGTLVAGRASVGFIAIGQVPSLLTTALAAAVVLAPACLLSGWIYGQLARAAAGEEDAQQGTASARAYWMDTLGAGIAGALLALVALDHLLPFRIAGISALIVFAGAYRLLPPRLQKPLTASGLLAALLAAIAPVDRWTYRFHAPGHEILEVATSPHGAVLVTRTEEQTQVLLQRDPIIVPSDLQAGEQAAHLVASLHPAPNRALVLGVPPGNMLHNLLAHPVETVDVVAGDERIATAIRTYAPAGKHAKVHVHGDDVRAWVRAADGQAFELVFVFAGAPTTVADARFYSASFYDRVNNLVAPDGLVAVAMPGLAAYASESERVLHSTVNVTLATAFDHLTVLPADTTFHIASHRPLPADRGVASTIASRLQERDIDAQILSQTWTADRLSADRIGQARRWSSRPVEPSTDTHPVVYRAALRSALERLGGGTGVLGVLAITLLALLATWVNPRSRPVSFSVATTGFAGLSLQLILMLVYQTAVGALYRDVALVTAAYMGASCLGTVLALRHETTVRRVLASDSAQLVAAAIVALGAAAMTQWGVTAARFGVVFGAVLVGLSTGAQFSFATRLRVFGAGVGGAVYALDLLGAALAALVTITFMVPWLGIAGTAWFVAATKLVSCLALAPRRSAAPESRALGVPLPTLLVLGVVVATVIPDAETHLTNWTLDTSFHVVSLVVLAGVLAMAFEPPWLHARLVRAERWLRPATRRIGMSPLRTLTFLVLLPAAALPLGRCYFSVPYLFCHACPRPCVFGVLRPYLVTVALIANFGDHRFCQRTCPLGHAQAAPALSLGSRPRAPGKVTGKAAGKVAWLLRLATLALVVYLYFAVASDHREETEGVGTYAWFYLGNYDVSAWVLAAAGAIIALAFVLERPFCDFFCPIGATSDLVTRLEKRARRRRES